MESICGRDNMLNALQRVESNKGAPGVDGMRTTRLRGYIRQHWEKIRGAVLDGTYEPKPARRKEEFLSETEWCVLFRAVNKQSPLPQNPPPIRDAVIWIARLGGFLARKSYGMPGTLSLWRGWKRLSDLTHGWSIAQQAARCG